MQVNNYDADHDVLHVFLSDHYWKNSSSEEEADDIYVTRDDDTNELLGFVILDYKRNAEIVKKMYPQYNFSIGYSEGYSEG